MSVWEVVRVVLSALGIYVMLELALRHIVGVDAKEDGASAAAVTSRTGDPAFDREIGRLERRQVRTMGVGAGSWVLGMLTAVFLDQAWWLTIAAALVLFGALLVYVWSEYRKMVLFGRGILKSGDEP